MRKIGVVSVSRSDYGIYYPILREIAHSSKLELCLFVSGTHLSDAFGHTVDLIEADGFPVAERIPVLVDSDDPKGIAQSLGWGLIGMAAAYSHQRPDILVVLGDRFEMLAAALAALPFKIPVAHIHGGEETLGAFDNSLRHSITKLSHLHFASHPEYARRLIQMGEEPWRVIVSGAPALDNLRTVELLSLEEIRSRFGLGMRNPPLLVTFHPVTLEFEQTRLYTRELLAALEASGLPILFTMPSADTYGSLIRQMINRALPRHPAWQAVENLGTQGYFSLMSVAAAMVGNSSSGIIEAASFELPVVNIGTRQQGRLHASNVIDVGYGRSAIHEGIQQALDPTFKNSIKGLVNPYGDGKSAKRIVDRLKSVKIDHKLLTKPFFDLEYA